LDDDSEVNLDLIGNYPFLSTLTEEIEKVHEKLRTSQLYTLWLLYIELVDILMLNTTAERTGSKKLIFFTKSESKKLLCLSAWFLDLFSR
jgi:hypothetical protein